MFTLATNSHFMRHANCIGLAFDCWKANIKYSCNLTHLNKSDESLYFQDCLLI